MNTNEEQAANSTSDMTDILSDFSQFYILLLLSEGPIHGYGLIKEFKKRTDRNLSGGTLYPFLQKLESQALLIQSDESVGKRPRTAYTLTEKGTSFCKSLFQRFASITASAIEPNIKTCASCGVKVLDGAHYEEVNGTMLAFCCPHCAAAYKRM